MYLFVYGADYCPYTRNLWSRITHLPFTYVPYDPRVPKEKYWEGIRKRLGKERMTFPTLALVDGDDVQEVHLASNGMLVDMQDRPIVGALEVPPMANIVRGGDNAHRAFKGTRAFAYKPITADRTPKIVMYSMSKPPSAVHTPDVARQ